MSDELDEIKRKLNGVRTALSHLTDTVEAQTQLMELHTRQLDSIERIAQTCIDQGRGFSARLTALEDQLNGKPE